MCFIWEFKASSQPLVPIAATDSARLLSHWFLRPACLHSITSAYCFVSILRIHLIQNIHVYSMLRHLRVGLHCHSSPNTLTYIFRIKLQSSRDSVIYKSHTWPQNQSNNRITVKRTILLLLHPPIYRIGRVITLYKYLIRISTVDRYIISPPTGRSLLICIDVNSGHHP